MGGGFGAVWREFHDEFPASAGTFGEFGAGDGSDLGGIPDGKAVLVTSKSRNGNRKTVVCWRPGFGDDAQAFGRGAEGGQPGVVSKAKIILEPDAQQIRSGGNGDA